MYITSKVKALVVTFGESDGQRRDIQYRAVEIYILPAIPQPCSA